MGARYSFTSENGRVYTVIDGDPENRYYLAEQHGEALEIVTFSEDRHWKAMGDACREILRLAVPDDPSLRLK